MTLLETTWDTDCPVSDSETECHSVRLWLSLRLSLCHSDSECRVWLSSLSLSHSLWVWLGHCDSVTVTLTHCDSVTVVCDSHTLTVAESLSTWTHTDSVSECVSVTEHCSRRQTLGLACPLRVVRQSFVYTRSQTDYEYRLLIYSMKCAVGAFPTCVYAHKCHARTVAFCQDEHGTIKNIETMTKCEINDHMYKLSILRDRQMCVGTW